MIYNSLAGLAGAAAMLAVLGATVMVFPRPDDRRPMALRTPAYPAPVDRLAFVPPEAFTDSESDPEPPTEETWSEPEADRRTASIPEPPPSWATEVRPDAPARSTSPFALLPSIRLPWQSPRPSVAPRSQTLKARLDELTPTATARLAAKFQAAKEVWPPTEITLIAIKDERSLELHARSAGGAWKLIHRYKVLAASGGAGPKLRQGDKQVPEGIYGISFLNPNSAYHVSMRVNYPNAFDREMAAKDGRKTLGGDIMIHGKNLSAGCLAMGDEAVEELFVLAAQIGLKNVKLVIAPTDFRQNAIPAAAPGAPEWLPRLYADVATAMAEFKAPPSPGLLSFFMR